MFDTVYEGAFNPEAKAEAFHALPEGVSRSIGSEPLLKYMLDTAECDQIREAAAATATVTQSAAQP